MACVCSFGLTSAAACPGVCDDVALGGRFDYFNLKGQQVGSQLIVSLSRKLVTNDPADVSLDARHQVFLVYAMSADGSDTLRYHGLLFSIFLFDPL